MSVVSAIPHIGSTQSTTWSITEDNNRWQEMEKTKLKREVTQLRATDLGRHGCEVTGKQSYSARQSQKQTKKARKSSFLNVKTVLEVL